MHGKFAAGAERQGYLKIYTNFVVFLYFYTSKVDFKVHNLTYKNLFNIIF